MKHEYLSQSNSALKAIERAAGAKSQPVSEETKRKIALAAKIASKKIAYDSNVYMQSYIEQSDIKLGGPSLGRRK